MDIIFYSNMEQIKIGDVIRHKDTSEQLVIIRKNECEDGYYNSLECIPIYLLDGVFSAEYEIDKKLIDNLDQSMAKDYELTGKNYNISIEDIIILKKHYVMNFTLGNNVERNNI